MDVWIVIRRRFFITSEAVVFLPPSQADWIAYARTEDSRGIAGV